MRLEIGRAAVGALCLALLIAGAAAWAQTYPAKTVRYLVSGSAGSGADTIGRFVAEGMTQVLGRPVIVENRPGGGANIAAEVVAKSSADGYTIFQNTISQTVNATLYRKLNYDLLRDFAAVTQLANGPSMLVVHPSLPVKSVRELVKLAKARPGALTYASGGTGTFTFFAAELFKGQAAIDMLHVPYRGGGNALNAVLAGEAQVYFSPLATALPMARQGKLRPLAVTSLQRLAAVPDLPTIAESGYSGYQSGNWYGLLVPVATPAEIVSTIRSAAVAALKLPPTLKRMNELGYVIVGSTSQEFAAFMRSEIERQGRIIRALKLSAE